MTRDRDIDPQRLFAAHAAATGFYRSHLLDELRALSYLRSRGIVAATAHTAPWTIGYAPAGWTHLYDHLRADGYTDPELLAAGKEPALDHARSRIADDLPGIKSES